MTIQYTCCSVCGCEFNGVHSGPIFDEEETLWIWLELIDANIIPFDLLVAAKERADRAHAALLSSGHIWTKLPPAPEEIQLEKTSRHSLTGKSGRPRVLSWPSRLPLISAFREHDYPACGVRSRLKTLR